MSKLDCRAALLAAVAISAAAGGCGSTSPDGSKTPNPTPSQGPTPSASNPETSLAPGGVDWTKRTSGTASGLIAATSGHGLIVVVGNNGVILTSPDGIEWTKRPTDTDVAINDVIWVGDRFIAVGDSGTILTSGDGQTWTLKNTSPDYHLESVVWNGKLFVTVGGRIVNSGLSIPAILTSTDGNTWTRQSGGDGIFYGVAWSGFVFLAVGYNYNYTTVSDLSSPVAWVSLDGVEWDVLNPDVGQYDAFDSVIYDGKRFVASGGSRRIGDPFAALYFTADLNNWRDASVPTTASLRDVAFTGSEYIAVGKNGAIVMADSKGLDWAMRTSGTTENLNGVAASPVGWQLVAVGDNGTILTSPCGKKETSPSTSSPLLGIWKQDQDIIIHANGSKSPRSMDSIPVLVLSLAEDQSMTGYLLEDSRYSSSFEGTWSASGGRLSLSFAGSTATTDYTLTGNTLTLTFADTVEQESVTRKQIFLRQ